MTNDISILSDKRRLFSNGSFLIGSSLLVFYASLILIQSIFLLLGNELQITSVVLALFCVLGYLLFGGRYYGFSTTQISIGLFLFITILVTSGIVSSYFYDMSWDGRDYHQKAILRLSQGWNPIYTELEPKDTYYIAWLNHYPKGPWIAAASALKLTKDIEIGKCFNLLLMFTVFLIAFSYFILKPQFNTFKSIVISLVLAANPVSIYQSLSYYLDGQVSSLFILSLLFTLISLKKEDWPTLTSLAATILVGLNVKFTATTYVIIMLAVMVSLNWIRRKSLKNLPTNLLISIIVSGFIAVFIVGFNPYVSNLIRYGHPFYPIYGSDHFNQKYVMGGQMPSNFRGKPQLEKLFLSLFSRSQNTYQSPTGSLKVPFALDSSEIRVFSRADVRVGGWGPLFGTSLLLSVGALLPAYFVLKKVTISGLGLITLVFMISLLNPEVWWARYSPQLWLIPVIVLSIAWMSQNRVVNFLGNLIFLLILANIAMVSGAYLTGNLYETREVRKTLEELRGVRDEILVYVGPLDSIEFKLKANNISYHIVSNMDELTCPQELAPGNFYSLPNCTTYQAPFSPGKPELLIRSNIAKFEEIGSYDYGSEPASFKSEISMKFYLPRVIDAWILAERVISIPK